MEPKYKVNPLTGELQEYVFEYNGILALRNFTARVDGERLILHAANDVNFSILDSLVSEVEINGVVYDNPTAAQEALTRLTFNQNRPVLLDKSLKDLILGAVQKVEGKGLSSNDFTNAYKQQLDTLEDYDIELDESTTELKFKKGSNVIKRISLMFLDDEGTKLVYNRTNKTLELRDKRDNLLTSIPVSHFVSNIPTGIVVQNGKIKLMAGSEVIDENTISYNDLADKPELNYLPLSGGIITPTNIGNHNEGIRISRASNGWSVLTLGTQGIDGIKDGEYALCRSVNGEFLLRTLANNDVKNLITVTKNNFVFSNGITTLFEVNNESTHTDKMFDAPIMRLHTAGSDFIALNSKDYKLNVKVGSAGRDDGEFKRVLAAGYEIPNGVHTRLLTANGENYGLGVGQKQIIDLKGLPEDKYYLITCVCNQADRKKVRVHNALDYLSKPSWCTHIGGFSVSLEFEQTGAGWGTTNADLNITQYYYGWTNVEPIMNIGQLNNSSTMYMYLRGGGSYNIFSWSQIGDSTSWTNHRKTEGEYENSEQTLPYCMDWNENLKINSTYIRTYKDGNYGVITNIDKSVVIRGNVTSKGIIIENNLNTARFKLSSNLSEMWVTTENENVFTSVRASGYKIQGKDDNYILTAGGSSIHRKDLVSRVIDVKTSTFDITPENVGNTAHVYNNCSLNYNTMPLSSTFAVRKVFDGGEVKFTGTVEAIYTGDRVLNGKKGSTAIIDYSSDNTMIFVDIRNI